MDNAPLQEQAAGLPPAIAGEVTASLESPDTDDAGNAAIEIANKKRQAQIETERERKFKELKLSFEYLRSCDENCESAEADRKQAEEDFAHLCHELWLTERAQGSRKEKGFRAALKKEEISVGRAYRAMKKHFPADFPPKQPRSGRTKSATPVIGFSENILQLALPFSPDEKSYFEECLFVLGDEEAKRVIYEAITRHAEEKRSRQHDQQPSIAQAQAERASAEVEPASIKIMVTKTDEAALRERGYSDSEIRTMMPEQVQSKLEPQPEPQPAELQPAPPTESPTLLAQMEADTKPVRFGKVPGMPGTYAIWNAKGDKLDMFDGEDAGAKALAKFTAMLEGTPAAEAGDLL